jgi:hypothetical protein
LQRVGGQLAFTSPKTRRSRRAIPLPRAVVKVLREHKQRQAVERTAAELWADDDLVFTTSIGTPIEPRNLSRHFEALRVRARLRKVRFHDLRHSCASLLFELGVPLRMVMEILGHSQISTTSDIFTHVMPAQYREVADVLDAWLDGGGQAEEDGDDDALLIAAGVHVRVHAGWAQERQRPRPTPVRGLFVLVETVRTVKIGLARSEGLEPPTF